MRAGGLRNEPTGSPPKRFTRRPISCESPACDASTNSQQGAMIDTPVAHRRLSYDGCVGTVTIHMHLIQSSISINCIVIDLLNKTF